MKQFNEGDTVIVAAHDETQFLVNGAVVEKPIIHHIPQQLATVFGVWFDDVSKQTIIETDYGDFPESIVHLEKAG